MNDLTVFPEAILKGIVILRARSEQCQARIAECLQEAAQGGGANFGMEGTAEELQDAADRFLNFERALCLLALLRFGVPPNWTPYSGGVPDADSINAFELSVFEEAAEAIGFLEDDRLRNLQDSKKALLLRDWALAIWARRTVELSRSGR